VRKTLAACRIATVAVLVGVATYYGRRWTLDALGPILLTLLAAGVCMSIGPSLIEATVRAQLRDEHERLTATLRRIVDAVSDDAAQAVHLAREEGFRDGLLTGRLGRAVGEPPHPRRHLRPVSGD
jgi:hypothetical protein